jgi:predicted nucleic acid-binding protein
VRSCVLDTNILVVATDESRPFHAEARKLISRGRTARLHGGTSGQFNREYLVVAIRLLSANRLGLSPADALGNIVKMTRHLPFCDEPESVSVRLRSLVGAGEISGKAIHDANSVATLMEHGIGLLATENPENFALYLGIGMLRLSEVEAQLSAAEGPH